MTPASVQHQVCGGLTGSTSSSTSSSQETAEIAKTRASFPTNTNSSFTFERVSVALEVATTKNQSKLTTRLAGMYANLGPCPHIECHECQMKCLSTRPFNFISRHAHRCVAKVLNKYVLQIFDAAYLCYERPLSRSQGAHCMQMKTLLSVRAKSAAQLLHPGPSYPAVRGSKLGPTSLWNEQNLSEFQFQVDVSSNHG